MAYLIADESHHRGQIMLALKQNGLKLPEDVAVGGVWGRWCRRLFAVHASKAYIPAAPLVRPMQARHLAHAIPWVTRALCRA